MKKLNELITASLFCKCAGSEERANSAVCSDYINLTFGARNRKDNSNFYKNNITFMHGWMHESIQLQKLCEMAHFVAVGCFNAEQSSVEKSCESSTSIISYQNMASYENEYGLLARWTEWAMMDSAADAYALPAPAHEPGETSRAMVKSAAMISATFLMPAPLFSIFGARKTEAHGKVNAEHIQKTTRCNCVLNHTDIHIFHTSIP